MLLAAGLHAVAVLALVVWAALSPPRPPPAARAPDTRVAFRPLTADQWARNRGAAALPVPTRDAVKVREVPRPEEKKDLLPKGQVVATPPGNDEKPPDDAAYLAERNNRVEKESRAREQTADYQNAASRRTSPDPQRGPGRESTPAQGNGGLAQNEAPPDPARRAPRQELPDVRRREQLALKDPNVPGPGAPVAKRRGSEDLAGNSDRLNVDPGQDGKARAQGSEGRVGRPGALQLTPSDEMLGSIVGAAPNDHLEDEEVGDGTLLNTREFKYASFFNRVKQGVARNWDPGPALRRRDPTGRIFEGRERVTMLEVELDRDGRLRDVRVARSSGLDFLDVEAVRAFERAQPFPHPPGALLTQNGVLRFEFGFYLDMGGGPRLRMFRPQN